jgi:hypothetical protein
VATITTRSGKGSALTHQEVDDNFTGLNTELGQKEVASNKGIANGYASLDAAGKVPSAQLPSYVDDVVEVANFASLPGTGETGKIYVTVDTNKTYRWAGSSYIEISASPGSTDSLAEGSTNLYFTQARARASISASGSLSYNSSTGVMSFTDAVTSVAGRTGAVTLTSSDVGLGNVENKSSATIRGEITSSNVTTALGFTPYNATNPNGYITSSALSSYLPLSGGTMTGNASFAHGANIYFGSSSNEAGPWTISVNGSGGATPATKGTGWGRNLIIKAGDSDNGIGLAGGDMFVRGGSPTSPSVVYGDVRIADLGGQVYLRSGEIALGSGNYNSYAPTLTGTGASGTWGISITGNAATVSGITSGQVTGALGYVPVQQGTSVTLNDIGVGGASPTDSINFSPWYGIGITNIPQAEGNYVQVAGFYGLRLRSANYVLDLPYTDTPTLNSNVIIHAGNYSSYALPLSGGTITGQISFSYTGDHAIQIGTIRGRPVGGQSGDFLHIYERVHIGSPAGWGTRSAPSYGLSTYGGADLATDTGAVRITTGSIAVGDAATRGLVFDGNYTNGQYRHRFRKQDPGAGLPLYIDYAHGTANAFTNIARFGGGGTYKEFSVYGSQEVVGGALVLDWNIASPSNYYNGLQLEVRATSGTAGIGFHRSGYSHVGIYHDALNTLKFNMNSGTVTLNHDAGTIIGTGNFSSYAVPTRTRSNWNDGTVINNVVGQLAWKNYGSNHTIFDASAGTSPDGTSVNNTNAQVPWGGTYPTLMGWNGANTYGVRVDSARIADSAVNGLTTSNYNSYALPLSGGTLTGNLISSGTARFSGATIAPYAGVYAGEAVGAASGNKLIYLYNNGGTLKLDAYDFGTSTPLGFTVGGNGGTVNLYTGATVNGNGILHAANYSSYALPLSGGQITGGVEFRSANQLTFSDGANSTRGFIKGVANTGTGAAGLVIATSGGESIVFKDGNADAGDINFVIRGDGVLLQGGSNQLLHAGNYTSYSPSLTGSGASGTWGINITGNAATATSASGAISANAVGSTGYGNGTFTWRQESGTFAGQSGWASYLISNHGDGATYYNQTLIMPFWSAPQYSRLEGGTFRGPYVFLSTENYSSYALPLSGGTLTGDIVFADNSARKIRNAANNAGYQPDDIYGNTYMFNASGGWYGDFTGYYWRSTGGSNLATLDGSGNFVATANVTAYSDERVKANWRTLDDGFVVRLAGVKCGIYDRTDVDLTQVGVSAQSLRPVLPHAVISSPDGDLSVAYGAAAMVSAVELAKELVTLRNKVAELEARIH